MAQKGVGFWSWTLSKVCNLTVGYQKQGVSSHFNVFFKSLFEYARSGLVRTMWNILVLVFFYLNKKHHPLKHGQVLKVPLAHSHLYFPLVVPLLPLPPPLHLPFPPNYNPDPLIQSCTLRALATGMLPPTSLQQWPPLPPPPPGHPFCTFIESSKYVNFSFQEFDYKTVEVLDLPETPICQYFPGMFDFIQNGLESGAVLVHW